MDCKPFPSCVLEVWGWQGTGNTLVQVPGPLLIATLLFDCDFVPQAEGNALCLGSDPNEALNLPVYCMLNAEMRNG